MVTLGYSIEFHAPGVGRFSQGLTGGPGWLLYSAWPHHRCFLDQLGDQRVAYGRLINGKSPRDIIFLQQHGKH